MAELSVSEFRQTAANIETQIGQVIVGQREVVRHVLAAIVAGGHVLLEGVPGLGKTMLVRTLADVLDLKFSRIQFTPDLMPADIVGTDILEDAADGRRAFRFQPGPVFANLVLADEINRATPKTPFFVMATQNPIEMEGTYPLPEAQLDRFLFKVNVAFPSSSELVDILTRTTGQELARASRAADGAAILAMSALARAVPVPTHVSDYVARLVVATHPENSAAPETVKRFVRYGSSPRGAQALMLGAKVTALLVGRYNVAFEDIRAVVFAALRHRLLLNFEAQAEGMAADSIIEELLKAVPTSKP
jgi:MoxR-like ATPase